MTTKMKSEKVKEWIKTTDLENYSKYEIAVLGWQACADQKDKEIHGLLKQVNAYKTLEQNHAALIEWRVAEGVKIQTCKLQSEVDLLSSEREANQRLTNELEAALAMITILKEETK